MSGNGTAGVTPKAGTTSPAQRRVVLLSNLLLVCLGLLFLAPMLWLFLASVDDHASWSLSLPTFTLAHLAYATSGDFLNALVNTFYMALVATVVSTVSGTLGGYALSRRRIPMRDGLMVAVLFLTGIPIAIMIIPVFQMFGNFNLLSLIPTGVFLGVTSLPFALWLIKTAMDSVPKELEEAAQIERAGVLQIILFVTAPLALPGIAAAAIFSFISAWGAFLVPLVLISDASELPGPILIYGQISASQTHYGDIAACSIVYSLPVVVLYILMSRPFAGGFLMSGAVKG
jgi:multiple sugar transport system permease protein